MSKTKTLAIAHRVCPALSKSAVGFDSKEALVGMTARSLAATVSRFNGVVRLHVILDGCPSWRHLFVESFQGVHNTTIFFVDTPSIGNEETYAKQLLILSEEKKAHYLYFSEDDYIYHPDAFTAMADFLDEDGVDFVTPLDHPDRYKSESHNHAQGPMHRLAKEEIRISRFCHWRTAENTCMTFMTTRPTMEATRHTLAKYAGCMDGTMWEGITRRVVFRPWFIFRAILPYLLRFKRPYVFYMPLCAWKQHGFRLLTSRRRYLWQPIPTLAVHLAHGSVPLHEEEILAASTDFLPNGTAAAIHSAALQDL